MNGFMVNDPVKTPASDWVATVVYLSPDGMVAVEYPDSAQWHRFQSEQLEHVR